MFAGSAEFLNRVFLSLEDWAPRLQLKANILTFFFFFLKTCHLKLDLWNFFPFTSPKVILLGKDAFVWHFLKLKPNRIHTRKRGFLPFTPSPQMYGCGVNWDGCWSHKDASRNQGCFMSEWAVLAWLYIFSVSIDMACVALRNLHWVRNTLLSFGIWYTVASSHGKFFMD